MDSSRTTGVIGTRGREETGMKLLRTSVSSCLEAVFAEYIFVETELATARQAIDQSLCILRRDENIRGLILAAEPGRRTQNRVGLDPDVTDDLGSFTAKQKMLLLPKTGQRNIQPPSFITGVRHDRGPYRVALVQQVGVQVLIDQLDCFYLVHEGFIKCVDAQGIYRREDKANHGAP